MASISSSLDGNRAGARTVGVLRLAIAAGLSMGTLFVLCWLGTYIAFSSPTHAFISLFTDAGISSSVALIQGTCWSALFGALAGAIFALFYNATAIFDRD